ncbi:hypothetical protein GCM10027435_25640 [Haloparvum alkalitolerans]|uniref:hypothetical protein n=1 Tax=Haloparvum alkalitolerans TaxID=1042953 RepID=UPI003CF5B311
MDPVRTNGDTVRVSQSEATAQDPVDILKSAVSNKSDCIVGEIPAKPYNSGLLITTKTTVRSLDNTNVAFPSPAYEHLKEIAPSSIVVTSAGEGNTTPDENPVYIKAVLEEGDSEEVIPSMTDTC